MVINEEDDDYFENLMTQNPTDYKIARIFNHFHGENFVCVDKAKKEFYCFDKKTKLWSAEISYPKS